MEEIKSFSQEVCEKLKYYVYRLVDPRNGKTFYVGKGKNNRVFAHAKCALASYSDVDYNIEQDSEDNLKYKTIREIKDSGLEVIYIIQKYGLEERDTFVVESALIDAYAISTKLTNKIKGFNNSEPINAITLQRDFERKEYVDSINNPKYMIIKIKDYWINSEKDRYECTRSCWKVKREVIKNYPYVLSVTGGIVREVYRVTEWHPALSDESRLEFTGCIAEEEVRKIFKDKKIPIKYRKKGQANPVLYCKIDEE